MFQVLEHPNEKEFLETLQELLFAHRRNFQNLIYNLTSNLTEEELDLLYNYANSEPVESIDDENRKVNQI